MQQYIRMGSAFLMAMVSSAWLCADVLAGDPAVAAAPKKQVVAKELTGEISGISGNFLSVNYGIDPASGAGLEAAFVIDRKKTKLIRRSKWEDLSFGDTVLVAYDEVTQTRDDGRKVRASMVKSVTFVQPGAPSLSSREDAAAANAVQK
ncbi:MAG: hypothetical protein NC924_00010 [Candidatus Omnitrophica bacterium]|nr:hypothetical protein [Candidatus Omnitrophota bacterium]